MSRWQDCLLHLPILRIWYLPLRPAGNKFFSLCKFHHSCFSPFLLQNNAGGWGGYPCVLSWRNPGPQSPRGWLSCCCLGRVKSTPSLHFLRPGLELSAGGSSGQGLWIWAPHQPAVVGEACTEEWGGAENAASQARLVKGLSIGAAEMPGNSVAAYSWAF